MLVLATRSWLILGVEPGLANALRLCVLVDLQETVECLDREADLSRVLHMKEVAVTIDKNPFHRALAYME